MSVTAAAFALPATTLAPDELLVVNVHGATHVTTSWRIEASAAWTNHAQVLEVSWMDHLPAWSPDWVIEMGSASWSVVVQNETSQRGIQGTFWPFD